MTGLNTFNSKWPFEPVNQLLKEGAHVSAYDPVASQTAKSIFNGKIRYASSALDCIKKADCAIIVTEWSEFQKLTPEDYVDNMKQPIIVDGRRIYDPEKYSKKLKFVAIGLGT